MRDAHADGAPEEQWPAAPFVDGVETRKSRRHVDGGGDHLDDEGIGEARILEILRAVVEDEIDT